jgi:hypothetical protein
MIHDIELSMPYGCTTSNKKIPKIKDLDLRKS